MARLIRLLVLVRTMCTKISNSAVYSPHSPTRIAWWEEHQLQQGAMGRAQLTPLEDICLSQSGSLQKREKKRKLYTGWGSGPRPLIITTLSAIISLCAVVEVWSNRNTSIHDNKVMVSPNNYLFSHSFQA